MSVEIPYSIERKLDMKQSDEDRVKIWMRMTISREQTWMWTGLVYLEVLMNWPEGSLQEDCKGICSQCGKNLNQGPCGCAEEPKDPQYGCHQ